jgi:hypothetical protein
VVASAVFLLAIFIVIGTQIAGSVRAKRLLK